MPPELKQTEDVSSKPIAISVAPAILNHIENNIDVRQHSPEVLRLMADSLAKRLQAETDSMLQSLREGTRAKQMMQEAGRAQDVDPEVPNENVPAPMTGAQAVAYWQALPSDSVYADQARYPGTSAEVARRLRAQEEAQTHREA